MPERHEVFFNTEPYRAASSRHRPCMEASKAEGNDEISLLSSSTRLRPRSWGPSPASATCCPWHASIPILLSIAPACRPTARSPAQSSASWSSWPSCCHSPGSSSLRRQGRRQRCGAGAGRHQGQGNPCRRGRWPHRRGRHLRAVRKVQQWPRLIPAATTINIASIRTRSSELPVLNISFVTLTDSTVKKNWSAGKTMLPCVRFPSWPFLTILTVQWLSLHKSQHSVGHLHLEKMTPNA